MSTFRFRLDKILSEMPVRHFIPAGNRYEGPPIRGYGPGERAMFKGKTYDGYVSPKYMRVLSDKLSKISGYNINIFIIEAIANPSSASAKAFSIDELSAMTNLPISELTDAINFIMTGNREQREFSSWMYMHQLGEAITERYADGDDFVFKDFYSKMEQLDPQWYLNLKMGSARTAKEDALEDGFGEIEDLHQELITEYLWHGGRIRFDYGELDKSEVDAAFNSFYSTMDYVLADSVGQVLINDAGG